MSLALIETPPYAEPSHPFTETVMPELMVIIPMP
jgi:hypothetical protein